MDVCTEGEGRERADLHTKCGVACQRRIQLGCIDAIVDAMQMRQRAERLLLRGRLDREACSRVRDTAFRGSWRKGKGRERERERIRIAWAHDRSLESGGFRDKEGIFDPWTIF